MLTTVHIIGFYVSSILIPTNIPELTHHTYAYTGKPSKESHIQLIIDHEHELEFQSLNNINT